MGFQISTIQFSFKIATTSDFRTSLIESKEYIDRQLERNSNSQMFACYSREEDELSLGTKRYSNY